MNQILKRCVYNMGTDRQAEFLADLGGMKPREKEVFMMMHADKGDDYIMDTLGYTKKSYAPIEKAVRTKLLLAVMECINECINNQMLAL